MVLLDEAYVDFIEAPDRAARTALAALGSRPASLVLLRTFSKITGLAGLRVGYAIADPAVIGQLERVREPFNVGRLAQAGAAAAARDTAHRETTRRVVWAERRRAGRGVRRAGLAHPPTEANFFLVRLGRPDAARWSRRSGRGACWCATGRPSAIPEHLRISVGTAEQNARLLAALDRALAG